MAQELFSGVKYGFRWVGDWYEYDGEKAEKKALKARNARAAELKAAGYSPRKFSLGVQLRSLGGMGSGHPHVEVLTKCYGVNY